MKTHIHIAIFCLLVCLGACSKSKEERAASQQPDPNDAATAPALTITKESREQLQKAKEINQILEKSAQAQRQAIDEMDASKREE